MTRCVEESDQGIVVVHLIRTDVLGDPARLAGDDLALSVEIQDRGLAVVDVTHDCHDGRARLEHVLRLLLGCLRLDDDFLDLVETLILVALLALEGETVDLAHLCGDLRLQRLVRRREHPELDQIRHHIERFKPQPCSKIRNKDRRLDDNQLRIIGFLTVVIGGDHRRVAGRRHK